jgi:hypothetical protein
MKNWTLGKIIFYAYLLFFIPTIILAAIGSDNPGGWIGWMPATSIVIAIGIIFGFISFKIDVDQDFSGGEGSNESAGFILMVALQIVFLVATSIGWNTWVELYRVVFKYFSDKDLSRAQCLAQLNTLIAIFFVITSPVRRLIRIEQHLLNKEDK